jgi:hypothetical protein
MSIAGASMAELQQLRVAPAQDGDRPVLDGSFVVEAALVDPARSLVERASAGIAGDDREPGLPVEA